MCNVNFLSKHPYSLRLAAYSFYVCSLCIIHSIQLNIASAP
uniref:Uncharacterized protein n=1 Tax=Anguilla anguilla TaxID=7936 RepID=A0A0E9TIY2_ANGAN